MLKELTEEERKSACCSLEAVWTQFLIHARNLKYSKAGQRASKGDIVFFRRKSGQFVSCTGYGRIRPEGYYIVGDAQTQIEGPVKKRADICSDHKVREMKSGWSGRFLVGNSFEHVWLHMIRSAGGLCWCYGR